MRHLSLVCLLTGLSLAVGATAGQAQVLEPLPPAIPAAEQLPPPVTVVPIVKPITHQVFADCFKPAPGDYEIVFIHPGSCCPVKVCFTLPCGCPKVRVHKRELVFDYGREEVVIRFQLFGKVKVSYR